MFNPFCKSEGIHSDEQVFYFYWVRNADKHLLFTGHLVSVPVGVKLLLNKT